jgi:hypothetical protein
MLYLFFLIYDTITLQGVSREIWNFFKIIPSILQVGIIGGLKQE